MTVQRLLDEYPLRRVVLLEHGFTSWMRDYDVQVEAAWSADRQGRWLYRFGHCPVAHLVTRVPDDGWRAAWGDIHTDYDSWMEAGQPDGFVWGMRWSFADPGLRYVEQSRGAALWTQRMGRPMHEVRIVTEAFELQLIFHDLIVRRVSDELTVLDPVAERAESAA